MRWLLCLLIACGGAAPASLEPDAPKQKVGDRGVDIANLSAQLPAFIDSIGAGDRTRAFSGYVLVAQHDQILWRGAYGLADRARQRVPTADTSFRIASVTKQFTAAAILKLEQDGKLRVDDTVAKHLPEYPGPGKDVTIHQLLTHTAGIPNDTAQLIARMGEKLTPKQLLELFWDQPLDFEPGSKFAYSNNGYVILGAIIERASGQPYAAYMQKALFEPAGLTRTVVGDAPGIDDRAEGYALDDGEIVPAAPIDMSMPYAAGAVRSTAIDLMKWHRALEGNKILGPPAKAKLYKPARSQYAYGWVALTVMDRPALWHNGGIPGFRTTYWRVPDADLVVVAWTNVMGIDVDAIGKAAVEAALGGKLKPIEPRKPGTLDAAVADRLAGTYEMGAREKERVAKILPSHILDTILTIEVAVAMPNMTIKPNGQSVVELAPLADGSLYSAPHDIQLRFELPPSGPIPAFTLEQGKLAITYTRR